MQDRLTYHVNAPGFSETNGGAIFMHGLVRTLRDLGEDAWLVPLAPIYRQPLLKRIRRTLSPPEYRTAPGLEGAVRRNLDPGPRDVVVYPEIVQGNPLRAESVARWLLYPPGQRHPFRFGPDEMFFRVGEICDLPEITGGAPDLIMWKPNPAYRNENRSDRKGVCYIVRKGDAKARIPETEAPEAIQVDGMSHAEMNDIFNACETFYSYDEATMYSQFAALCGCDSIIIPGMFNSQRAWMAEHEMGRYGVAYGVENLDHARATRHLVADMLKAKEEEGRETVRTFVRLTRERFLP